MAREGQLDPGPSRREKVLRALALESKTRDAHAEHKQLTEKGIRGIGDLLKVLKSGVVYASAEHRLALLGVTEQEIAETLRADLDRLTKDVEDSVEALYKFEKEELGMSDPNL